MKNEIKVEGGLRTNAEIEESKKNQNCFDQNPESWSKKNGKFSKVCS
tara:strand:- start:930 stop:1070 length:141 start_codon:yes stop_codon:yes gene_type:complete